MKEEVIELEAIWYGGGYHFRLLNDKTGLVLDLDDYNESKKPSQIEDSKIINFWKKVEELGVWQWHKKLSLLETKISTFTLWL